MIMYVNYIILTTLSNKYISTLPRRSHPNASALYPVYMVLRKVYSVYGLIFPFADEIMACKLFTSQAIQKLLPDF
jgi:hypothetical protein